MSCCGLSVVACKGGQVLSENDEGFPLLDLCSVVAELNSIVWVVVCGVVLHYFSIRDDDK